MIGEPCAATNLTHLWLRQMTNREEDAVKPTAANRCQEIGLVLVFIDGANQQRAVTRVPECSLASTTSTATLSPLRMRFLRGKFCGAGKAGGSQSSFLPH